MHSTTRRRHECRSALGRVRRRVRLWGNRSHAQREPFRRLKVKSGQWRSSYDGELTFLCRFPAECGMLNALTVHMFRQRCLIAVDDAEWEGIEWISAPWIVGAVTVITSDGVGSCGSKYEILNGWLGFEPLKFAQWKGKIDFSLSTVKFLLPSNAQLISYDK